MYVYPAILVLILTDGGHQGDAQKAVREAEKLKSEGAVVMVVGVGEAVDKDSLVKVASHSKLFTAKTAESLSTMSVRLSVILCHGKTYSVMSSV